MKVKYTDKIIKYIKKHYRVVDIKYIRYNNEEYLYIGQDSEWLDNDIDRIGVYLFNNDYLYKSAKCVYNPKTFSYNGIYTYKRCLNDN